MNPCESNTNFSLSNLSCGRHLAALACLLLLAGCSGESGPDAAPAVAENEAATMAAESAEAVQETLDPVELAAEVMTEADYRRHVETLASDEFGGRAPASPGEELTVNYLIGNFREMGLEPANGDSYTQAVPLAWVEATNNPNLVLTGPDGLEMTLKYPTEQVIWTRQQVAETSIEDSELVFVGYGIVAPEYDWDDYADVDVEGKTVVILINDPGYATQNPDLFNGNAMTYYGRWGYKFGEANRHGAAGAIIIHDRLPAAYPWSTVENSWTGRKFNLELADKGASLMSLEGWIQKENAAAVFAAAGLDLDEMVQKALEPDFSAVPLGLKASASLVNRTEDVPSQNVAAILRGSEAPDEIFIYMAHWDHLGTDPKLEGDQIYNGALDNASGTAALLEIARAFAALPVAPRRSVLFLALTAEEQGLLGSLYYATHPLFPLEQTVGGLNMDGMNNFGATRDITVVGLGMSDLDDYLASAAAAQERVVNGDREAEKGYYYRSDHFELAREGVPMLYPKKGYNDRARGLAYGMAKAEEYTNEHYHRVSDEYDLSWDVSGAMEDMRMYFKTGLDVANSDDWPNWKEGTEFKATRDAQMSKE
jgi:Zn-dependent M28 family amino/carboxypeptidase